MWNVNVAFLRSSLCASSLALALAVGCAGQSLDPDLEREEALADEEAEQSDTDSLPTPTVIASGQEFPSDVEVDGSSAYWATAPNFGLDPGSVRRASKSGGGAVTEIQAGIPDIGGIEVDASRVYWSTGAAVEGVGGIQSEPKAGGEVVDVVAATRVFNFALQGSDIYFLSPDAGGRVLKVARTGGAVTTLAEDVGPGLDFIPFIAIGGGKAFFTQSTFEGVCDGRVRFVSLTGGALVTVAEGICGLRGIGADHRAVYWTEFDTTTSVGRVVKKEAPFTSGSPVVLATVTTQPFSLALDDASVYYTTGSPADVGQIRKVSKFGGGRRVLATDQLVPLFVNVDQSHVYWTTPFDGEVKRVPK